MFFIIQFSGTQNIRIPDHSRQRRLQFMGKGCDEILTGADLILQLMNVFFYHMRHMVKIFRQLTHFVAADLLAR